MAKGSLRLARVAAGLLGLLALAPGCTSTTTTIYVDCDAETNGGRPLHIVIRAVDDAEFATDTYDKISRSVFARPADESVLLSTPVFPGVERELEVEKPEKKPLAIYFLFTEPGERWKVPVKQPMPDTVEIRLGTDQILDVTKS